MDNIQISNTNKIICKDEKNNNGELSTNEVKSINKMAQLSTPEENHNIQFVDEKEETKFKEFNQNIQPLQSRTPEEINNRIEEIFKMKVYPNKLYSSKIDKDVLNALNRMFFYEHRDISEIIEKALIRYIPAKYFKD